MPSAKFDAVRPESSGFQVFDLAAFESADGETRQRLGAQIDEICRSTGFLAIAGHGVPEQTIQAAWQAARRFFDLPQEAKQKSRVPYAGYPYGYIGPEKEALAASRGEKPRPISRKASTVDQRRRRGDWPMNRRWRFATPRRSGRMSLAISNTRGNHTTPRWKTSAARIMAAFAVALHLPENYFDTYIDQPVSALRALNYPEQAVPPRPGQQRAGAHSDYGSLTISAAAARLWRPADSQPRRKLDRSAAGSRRVCHQYR